MRLWQKIDVVKESIQRVETEVREVNMMMNDLLHEIKEAV
jgi:hypothetical protein